VVADRVFQGHPAGIATIAVATAVIAQIVVAPRRHPRRHRRQCSRSRVLSLRAVSRIVAPTCLTSRGLDSRHRMPIVIVPAPTVMVGAPATIASGGRRFRHRTTWRNRRRLRPLRPLQRQRRRQSASAR